MFDPRLLQQVFRFVRRINTVQYDVAHASWHLSSSLHSQEQELLLSALQLFYKPAQFLHNRLPHNSVSSILKPRGHELLPVQQTALQLCFKIFIAEMSFWLGIAIAKLSAPSGALQQQTRVPCKLSENLELTNDSSSTSPYPQ